MKLATARRRADRRGDLLSLRRYALWTLLGRRADYHSLHFETCYYQGIDYCIEHGLAHFEPGTQGEHKLARGFEPALTWSAHWIADAPLRRAIGAYLVREARAIDAYAERSLGARAVHR